MILFTATKHTSEAKELSKYCYWYILEWSWSRRWLTGRSWVCSVSEPWRVSGETGIKEGTLLHCNNNHFWLFSLLRKDRFKDFYRHLVVIAGTVIIWIQKICVPHFYTFICGQCHIYMQPSIIKMHLNFISQSSKIALGERKVTNVWRTNKWLNKYINTDQRNFTFRHKPRKTKATILKVNLNF